jgi:hypothetical protein
VELTETQIFSNPYNSYSPFNRSAIEYFLRDEEYYRQFLASTRQIQRYQHILIGKKRFRNYLNKTNLFRELLWISQLNHYLVRSYFYYAIQARGMNRILEKSPRHIFFLKELKATFPHAKLLFIFRHPVDVFSSYKKRLLYAMEAGVDKAQLRWLELSLGEFVHRYIIYSDLAMKEQSNNTYGFMTVKYEEFTHNTQDVLHRICEFLGESYEEQCLSEEKSKYVEWKVDPYLFGDITKKTKNWQDFIDEYEARFIEDRLYPIMNQLGYPRYTLSCT